ACSNWARAVWKSAFSHSSGSWVETSCKPATMRSVSEHRSAARRSRKSLQEPTFCVSNQERDGTNVEAQRPRLARRVRGGRARRALEALASAQCAGGGIRTRMPPRGHLVLSQARLTTFATPARARIARYVPGFRESTGKRSGPLPRNSSRKAANAFSLNRGQLAITACAPA